MTKTDKLRVSEYVCHVLQAIQRINRYTGDMTEGGFRENEMTQDAVIRNIEIIGEAAKNIERHHTIRASPPGIPLRRGEDICLIRNAVAQAILRSIWRLYGGPSRSTCRGLKISFARCRKIYPKMVSGCSLVCLKREMGRPDASQRGTRYRQELDSAELWITYQCAGCYTRSFKLS